MIKQISTYGAVILTAMVIVRAATLEEEGDISSLYQRNQDTQYISDNLDFRTQFNIPNLAPAPLLAAVLKVPATDLAIEREVYRPIVEAVPVEELNLVAEVVEELDEIVIDEPLLADEDSGLSLDRESTINTRLSLLFPRQRIEPKPLPASLQE